MNSTNRAFIDAYRHPSPAGGPSVSAVGSAASPAPLGAPPAEEPILVTEPEMPYQQPAWQRWQGESTKRPLSAVQQQVRQQATRNYPPAAPPAAMASPEILAPPVESSPTPVPPPPVMPEASGVTELIDVQWPVVCQQLLATAADRYDTVLRRLPVATGHGQLLGIAGCGPQAGCTTTAICLALRWATLGFTTALLDADTEQPSLAQQLDVQLHLPWPVALASGQSILDAAMTVKETGIDLLLAHPNRLPPLDDTAALRMSLAAGALRRKYDRVVVDLGAIGGSDAETATKLAVTLGIDNMLLVAGPTVTDEAITSSVEYYANRALAVAGVFRAE